MVIEDKLNKQDPILVGLYCLLAVARLGNIYEAFSRRFSIPYKDFSDILQKAYGLIFCSDKNELGLLKNNLGNLIPDTEEFNDVLADQAQCAAIAMMYALEYISDGDQDSVGYLFQKIEEAMDIYGYEGGEDASVRAKEAKWQIDLLKMLCEQKDLSLSSLSMLEELNGAYSIPHV